MKSAAARTERRVDVDEVRLGPERDLLQDDREAEHVGLLSSLDRSSGGGQTKQLGRRPQLVAVVRELAHLAPHNSGHIMLLFRAAVSVLSWTLLSCSTSLYCIAVHDCLMLIEQINDDDDEQQLLDTQRDRSRVHIPSDV